MTSISDEAFEIEKKREYEIDHFLNANPAFVKVYWAYWGYVSNVLLRGMRANPVSWEFIFKMSRTQFCWNFVTRINENVKLKDINRNEQNEDNIEELRPVYFEIDEFIDDVSRDSSNEDIVYFNVKKSELRDHLKQCIDLPDEIEEESEY